MTAERDGGSGVTMPKLRRAGLRAASVAVALCAVLAGSSARAGWQYTDWEMTPEAVVAESAGAARLLEVPTETQSGLLRLAVGRHRVDIFEFHVTFLFRPSDEKLDRVVLSLENVEVADRLFEALRGSLGEPTSQELKLIPGGESHSAMWEKEEDNNRIEYKGGINQTLYVIYYSPIARENF